MTQMFGSQGDEQQQYNENPPPSDQYGSRGMSDEYYGSQHGQANYSQPAQYGQQQYGQQPYDQGYQQQAPHYNNPSYGQQQPYGGPETYPTYGSQEPGRQYGGYDPNSPYQQQMSSPPPGAPPAYGDAPYNPSAAPPVPAVKPDGTPTDPDDPEQRGIMGALAGGAAGGYAGHKMHHGVLGTLGGAYAGHKLEEAYKHQHQKPPPQHHGPPAPAGHSNQPGQQLLGNFSSSSRKISLDRDYDLIAEAATIRGDHRLSSLSLNACLTNDNGRFKWQRDGNFAASAREVHLTPDGRELRAELRTVDGRWQRSSIRLDERITNDDGNLQVVW